MSEDIHPALQVVLAFVGTGGGAAALIALARELWKARQSNRMDTGFLDISTVWEEVQTLGIDIGADRVLIMKSENGGGLPAPGSVIKSSVVFEYRNNVLPSVRAMWQQVLLDSHYSDMLSMISTGAWYWESTQQMPEGAAFRDLTGDGVLCGVARICKTPQALWYLVAQFKNADAASPVKRQKIRAALHRLRILFGKHHNLLIGEAT